MCGIVGAVSKRNVVPILLDGLYKLEYRGYDSAGIVVFNNDDLLRIRCEGKVKQLDNKISASHLNGSIGLAHTRWATHGVPAENNAHPHIFGDRICIVHNGIVENYVALRESLPVDAKLTSDTDSEIIAALIYYASLQEKSILAAVQQVVKQLVGSFAIGVLDKQNPTRLIVAKMGSPVVIGMGAEEEYFIASDHLALQNVAKHFMLLDDGDVAEISLSGVNVFNQHGQMVAKKFTSNQYTYAEANKGSYQHFMQKEIFEQANSIASTLRSRITKDKILESSFGYKAHKIFDATKNVVIIACGTSYYAGLVAKYWLESIANIHCDVEVASEYRYRKKVTSSNTLIIAISQSGETADTIAAVTHAKQTLSADLLTGVLAICNVPNSSLTNLADLVFLTHAGPEIGVASTKAFTSQLCSLLMLAVVLGRRNGISYDQEFELVREINLLPEYINKFLALDNDIKKISNLLGDSYAAIFLGRGLMYPIALEGSLKLKEISYIHAQAFPAGELKHGPLALVDNNLPVIILAAEDELFDKVMSNLSEVKTRGGKIILITSVDVPEIIAKNINIIKVPSVNSLLSPILYTIPLQLLAYYVAILKGTDVDQPRNLAKSVTVE